MERKRRKIKTTSIPRSLFRIICGFGVLKNGYTKHERYSSNRVSFQVVYKQGTNAWFVLCQEYNFIHLLCKEKPFGFSG
jgi:hypothetical protein